MALRQEEIDAQFIWYGEVKHKLGKISPMYHTRSFCDCLISVVNVVMAYHDDFDGKMLSALRKITSMMSSDQCSKVDAEELARKWNTGLQTVKDTLQVITQAGILMAIHPMT